MLSLDGFKHHLVSIHHQVKMYEWYKGDAYLKSVDNSKQVLIANFIKQQEKIDRYEETLKYIAGENGSVFADTLEEAKKSALISLEED
ncbi:hypothetical protein AB1L05_13110 [Cytobacillus horneckiae]|uniref:hypothetical protein n=1 Tax=Cytobacillus horneckiae TaxID=549687 RepID=UPI0039A39907